LLGIRATVRGISTGDFLRIVGGEVGPARCAKSSGVKGVTLVPPSEPRAGAKVVLPVGVESRRVRGATGVPPAVPSAAWRW
jgi:hypothetical protein